MKRIMTLGLIVVLLIAGVGMIPAIGGAQEPTEEPESTDGPTPGELLTGVVGVQSAELEGEVDRRAFGIQVANAATNQSRADAVIANLEDQKARLNQLEARKSGLDEARENGSISNGTYNAQVTIIAAQTANVKQQLNASENATSGLPVAVLESKGINTTAIMTLKHNASNMTGPEVAAIAKTIAGPEIGTSIANDRAPDSVGPPEDIGPSTDTGLTWNDNRTDNRPSGPPDNAESENRPDSLGN